MTNQKQMESANPSSAIELTDIGQQYLIAGCRPVTQKERLELVASLPMQPKRPCRQKPCDVGLFDEVSRNQMDFFNPSDCAGPNAGLTALASRGGHR